MGADIEIDTHVDGGRWPTQAALDMIVERAVSAAMARTGLEDLESELSVLFTDDESIRTLNAQWRGKNTPTNVLSFPAQSLQPGQRPGAMLGDIICAYETVRKEAELEGKAFDVHLTHLVVHGFLHLLGYDHENDTEAEEMEALERAILADMGIADPYSLVNETLDT